MKMLLLFISLQLAASLSAQIPAGYYDSALGLTGSSLQTALNDIIQDHTEFPYSSSGTDVWDILKETDKDTNDANNVILLYSGWSLNGPSEFNSGSGWNREHVWPQSRGNFGTGAGPGTDVHALRPCDISVNSARSNRWFAECTQEYIDADGATGSYLSASDWFWKPRDEVKGDVARMIFYMATRYEGEGGEVDLRLINSIPSDNNTSEPIHAKLTDLLQWNDEDPVDDWERNRNDIIYYDYQNNRNPFIDHPEYAMEIWGIYLNTPQIGADVNLSVYPNPADSQISVNWPSEENYSVKVFNLKGKLKHKQKSKKSSTTVLDLSDLESGVYLVRVSTKGNEITRKIVLQ
ncbi:MAG: endonuclease I [Flavobacteriaceae bacterium]|jgi:endonuclease I